MREFKLEPYLVPDAREIYSRLYGLHQEDVERRLEFLCRQPEPDNEITFAWPEAGPNVFIFYDDAWLITYSLDDDASVLVVESLAPVGWLQPGS